MLNTEIIDKLKNSERYIKKQLIDYLHGLPKDLTTYIKLHINDPYMDPSIYNSTTRKLYPESNIGKYLNKNINIINTDNADKSDYQVEYCRLMKSISHCGLNPKIKLYLKTIVDLESYDINTIKKLEINICNNKYLTDNEYEFIFQYIIPYKIKCYMAYDEFINDELNSIYNSKQLYNTYKEITDAYPNISDMSLPLYRYYKLIDVSIDELPLFIKRIPVDREKLLSELKSLYENDTKITNTYDSDNNIDTNITKFSNDDNSINGYIINIKYNKSIDEFEDITNIINRFKNKIDIIRELRTSGLSDNIPTNSNNISFELSENDYGNLKAGDEPDIYAGTIYSDNNDMYHILNKDNIIYLAFKNLYEPNLIYGISLNNENDKNILKFSNKKNSIYNVELPY